VSNAKRMFEKMSAIAVIAYFFYPFFIETGKEIASLYKWFSRFFWILIKENEPLTVFLLVIICLLAVRLVLWIVENDEQEKETIDEAKKEEILFNK